MPAKLGRGDELGLALSFLRQLKGWRQGQVAAAAGVSPSGLSALEQGKRRQPTLRTLGPVAAALGVDLALVDEMVALIRELRRGETPKAARGGASCDAVLGAEAAFRQRVREAVIATTSHALDGSGCAHQPSRPRLTEVGSAEELGLSLTLLRQVRGWRQKDLVAASGISLEVIQAIEQGRRRRLASELPAILAALGMDMSALAKVAALVRQVRRHQGTAQLPSTLPWAPPPHGWAPALRPDLAGLLHAGVQAASAVPPDQGERRRRVVALLPVLAECPPEAQRALARLVADLRTPEACQLLCEESLAAAGDSASRARQLAELAGITAELAEGGDAFRSRLRGYAGVHLANAERVAGRDLPAAGETLERALAAWDAGAGADSGLLNAARVCGLTASLRRAQRRLPEALAALDEALKIDRWGETPTLLLGKARALVELGDYEASIEQLRAAAASVEGEREPRKPYLIENLLVSNLCRLGQFGAAERRLPALRQLALPNRLDLLRVAWQTGTVAAGLGRTDQALAVLLQVRADFIATDNFYVAALVTLELAEVHAGLGHTAEVKALARESAPVFENQQVHREAQRALALFRQAAEEERASGELLRQLIVYLHRARHDPQLSFAARA